MYKSIKSVSILKENIEGNLFLLKQPIHCGFKNFDLYHNALQALDFMLRVVIESNQNHYVEACDLTSIQGFSNDF